MGRYYRRFGIHLCLWQRKPSCTGSYLRLSSIEDVNTEIRSWFACRFSNQMEHLSVNSAHAEKAKEILNILIILPYRIRIALSYQIPTIIAYKFSMWMDVSYPHSAPKAPKKDNSNFHGKILSEFYVERIDLTTKSNFNEICRFANCFRCIAGVLLSMTKGTSVSPTRATIASRSSIRMVASCVRLDHGARAMPNSKDWKVLLSCRMEIF